MSISKRKEIIAIVITFVAALFITAFLFENRVYADEIVAVAAAMDADNDGIADSLEAEIAAQQRNAEMAKVKAQEQMAIQVRAAEEARVKAENELAAKQKAIEDERNRLENERKAREEEAARKKAEEEAQKRFEESLTATGISDADFNALCKIVQAEDGHDSIEGRIGVANVILNRVRSPFYPNSIMGVINAPGQFGPVSNGSFAAAVPTASTVAAVKQAISGANTVGNALYFHRGRSFGNKMFITTAGAHAFFA